MRWCLIKLRALSWVVETEGYSIEILWFIYTRSKLLGPEHFRCIASEFSVVLAL